MIELLETALEDARNGEILGIAIAAVCRNGMIADFTDDCDSNALMGAVSGLKICVDTSWLGTCMEERKP